jgi:hypothetical protein
MAQNIKWYDALTTGNLLVNATPLKEEPLITLRKTINGCESDRILF